MEEDVPNRKRQREGSDAGEAISREAKRGPVITTREGKDVDDTELLNALQETTKKDIICKFKLEAIFLPKFDNESSDQSIRNQMKDLVASGSGYAEASLKHSGCK